MKTITTVDSFKMPGNTNLVSQSASKMKKMDTGWVFCHAIDVWKGTCIH